MSMTQARWDEVYAQASALRERMNAPDGPGITWAEAALGMNMLELLAEVKLQRERLDTLEAFVQRVAGIPMTPPYDQYDGAILENLVEAARNLRTTTTP